MSGKRLRTLDRTVEFREKVPVAWETYQQKIAEGTEPHKAERLAAKSVYPGDTNYSKTLHTWKNHLLWPEAAKAHIKSLWNEFQTACLRQEDRDEALKEALDLCLPNYPHRIEALEIWKACGEWPPVKEQEGESDGESHEGQEQESSPMDKESAAPSEEPSQRDRTDLGEYRLMPIAFIKIGRRFRKEMGDLTSLAQSIEEIGLQHPISVTPDGELIHGQRRLEAYKRLGRKEIPVIVRDLGLLLQGEHDENMERKNFTISESVAISNALKAKIQENANKRMSEGGKKKGGAKFAPHEKGKTRDKLAAAAGRSHESLKKAEEIIDAAKADPDKYGDLVEEMDRNDKVSPVYKKFQDLKKGKKPPETKDDRDSGSDSPGQEKKIRLELKDRPNLDLLFAGVRSLPEPIQGLLRQRAEELRKEILVEAERYVAKTEQEQPDESEEELETPPGNEEEAPPEATDKPESVTFILTFESGELFVQREGVPDPEDWEAVADDFSNQHDNSDRGPLLGIRMEDDDGEPYLHEIRYDG